MIKHTLFVFIFFMLIIFLNGCSSRQDVYISDTGEGTASIEINLDKMLTSYAGDLLGGFSNTDTSNINLFDIDKISSIISNLESVTLTNIVSDSSEKLHIKLGFMDPGKIFDKSKIPGTPNLISFSIRKVGTINRKKISLYLTRDNFSTALSLVGLKDSDILDTFGPQDNPYSKTEYLDLMEYLFEEYETSATIREIVKKSGILINLTVDGQIISCKGCIGSGSAVIINIPLLDIVTLAKPIEISVEWE